jgi:hypothetical protein
MQESEHPTMTTHPAAALPTPTAPVRTSILFNPPLTFEDAQALAAALARTMHTGGHVDQGRYLVCDDADVRCWGLDDVQWPCEPEQVYFTDELEVTSL